MQYKNLEGLTKSKNIENVILEFQHGLKQGFKKFSLMGTDLGSYGMDSNHDLADLLNELILQEGDYKISLRNVHPYQLQKYIDRFNVALKSQKIPYLEIAAESGSNNVLKLMNRNYTIEQYKEIVKSIRKAYPPIIIRTQLIAGFPGETEQDFDETMQLLEDVVFDYVEVYEFSERPGTAAAKIEPKIPDGTKRQRFLKLSKKAILNRTGRKVRNLVLNKI